MRKFHRLLLPLLLLLGALAACGSVTGGSSGPAPLGSGPTVHYVSVSDLPSSAMGDVRGTWPVLFADSSLPPWAVDFQVVLPGNWLFTESTVVSQVLALRPTVVTVVVGPKERSEGLGVAYFSAALRGLLGALHRARVPTVLVANLPPALGSSLPTSTASVAAYNEAVAADTAAASDVLVNVHASFSRALAAGRSVLTPAGGLTPLGEQLIASAFHAGAAHRPLWR